MKKRDLTYLWLLLTIFTIVTGFTFLTNTGYNTIFLVNGYIIDGTGQEPISRGFLFIEKGIIKDIGYYHDDQQLLKKHRAKIIDLEGKTVMPGIIDSHVHLEGMVNYNIWLDAGVTTLRDTGISLNGMNKVRRSIGRSLPQVLMSGPILTTVGGHPVPYGGSNISLEICGEDEARSAVKTLQQLGVDFIKVAITTNREGYDCLSINELRVIVKEAKKYGLPVSAHIRCIEDVELAIAIGVDNLAHSPIQPMSEELIKTLIDNGITMNTTFSSYYDFMKDAKNRGNEGLRFLYDISLKNRLENALNFIRAGGVLGLGTDFPTPSVSGGMPIKEMELMIEAGFTPMEVILSATRDAAKLCHIDNEVGTLEIGKKANIIVVDGNPLEDIKVLENVELVIFNGKIR